MKKVLALVIALLLSIVTITPADAITASNMFSDTVTFTAGSRIVRVNGVVSYIPVAPIVQSGRIFIPLRFAAQKFKASVTWDGFLGRIDIRTKDQIDLEFKIGDKRLYVTEPYNVEGANDWYQVNMDVAPFLRKGYTFVPIKYFAQALGTLTTYDARTKTVTVKRISTDGWKTFREPHTGFEIKFPGSWKVETQDSYLELYNNGTKFFFSYKDEAQANVISSAKALYLQQGWKLVQATGTFLKFTKWSGNDHLMKIISTKKSDKGSLVFTVDTLTNASQLDLLICDKMIPGAGI